MPGLSRQFIINAPKGSSDSNPARNINKRAVINFHKNYPNITNEEWSAAPGRGYLAVFYKGGDITVVGYNHNGTLHHTINYYGEDKLLREVRHIVKRVYYDYSITRIAEVNINDPDAQTTYVVYIQDGANLKKLTICNDEILGVQEILNG